MSRISCGDPSDVPCRCDPVIGCGHLSSWHRVVTRWVAVCTVPDCNCATLTDVCDHVMGSDGATVEDAAAEIRAMGIRL